MNRITYWVMVICIVMPATVFCQNNPEYVVYNGKKLTDGYDMGINTSGDLHNWLVDKGNELIMNYPAKQDWGATFVTVGKPTQSQEERQTRDFTNFDSLIISMKGAKGGELVDIGIKDKTNPDNGSETKKTVKLSNKYFRYSFTLTEFKTAELGKLYVVTEFVFGNNTPCKIFVNSIKFK